MKTCVSALALFLIAVGSATPQTASNYRSTANFQRTSVRIGTRQARSRLAIALDSSLV
jgi:hypothetical protein